MLFRSSGNLKCDAALFIDQVGLVKLRVNGEFCYSHIVPPEICYRVIMLAWGDEEDFEIEVSKIEIATVG